MCVNDCVACKRFAISLRQIVPREIFQIIEIKFGKKYCQN